MRSGLRGLLGGVRTMAGHSFIDSARVLATYKMLLPVEIVSISELLQSTPLGGSLPLVFEV